MSPFQLKSIYPIVGDLTPPSETDLAPSAEKVPGGVVEHNPCLGVPMPAKAQQRDQVLMGEEVRSIWQALDREGLVMAATFRMRLLTALVRWAGKLETILGGGRSPSNVVRIA